MSKGNMITADHTVTDTDHTAALDIPTTKAKFRELLAALGTRVLRGEVTIVATTVKSETVSALPVESAENIVANTDGPRVIQQSKWSIQSHNGSKFNKGS